MSQKTSTSGTKLKSTITKIGEAESSLAGDLTIGELTQTLRSLRGMETAELPAAFGAESSKHRLVCLKKALQAAVTLEYATIPPYLCALWSIKDELHPAAVSIREVVQEEMLHMALACNMLTSLGGTPQISSAVVNYPAGLPGGVHEGLIVHLSGLTKKSLAEFLWIERPVDDVPYENPYAEGKTEELEMVHIGYKHASDETIGEFYEEIRHGFADYIADPNTPPLSSDNQVTGPLAYTVIRNMDNVNYAIDLIQDQGEGSENNPEKTDGEFSHYYRFLQVFLEREYKWNSKKKILEIVGNLPFPEIWPMAVVPKGGYQQDDVSDDVWYYLDEFDNTYSKLLDQLQGAWTLGGQASLVHAYETMFGMQKFAKRLMQTKTPFGAGATYGPCFRYKPPNDRQNGS